MADVKAAREEVQKVVAFLVNRFGNQEDVFKHLTLALGYLQDDPKPRQRRQPELAKPTGGEPPTATASPPMFRRTRRDDK